MYAKKKELQWTFHAKKRMSERHITEDHIVKVLEKPDIETHARLKGCRRAERKLGSRNFGVVYQES
ncbi:MAG: DUF4258 domain-containing protein [Candidatus Poribacteria bacterium]